MSEKGIIWAAEPPEELAGDSTWSSTVRPSKVVTAYGEGRGKVEVGR